MPNVKRGTPKKSAKKRTAVSTDQVLRLIPSILGLVQEIARLTRSRPKPSVQPKLGKNPLLK